MRLLVIAGAALLVLAGCGRLIGENQTRSEMQASKAAYTDCLRGDPQDISVCETLRLIYKADLEAYKAAKVGGATVTIEK